MIPIKSLTLQQLKEQFARDGIKPIHAKTVFKSVYQNAHILESAEIPKQLGQYLKKMFSFHAFKACTKVKATDKTTKFAFTLSDNKVIESVFIPQTSTNTLCISCQVGCKMNCSFCATGQMGYTRNLTVDEIVDQVDFVIRQGYRVDNIVYMGMGEPLDNKDAIIHSIHILTDVHGHSFSKDAITVSTCGVVGKIKSFYDATKVNLAISLHGTDDVTRSQLMPINKAFNLEKLFDELRSIKMKKKQVIMFEYLLLDKINDSNEDCNRLIELLHGIPSYVNLIEFNAHSDLKYKASPKERFEYFEKRLREHKIKTFKRYSRGDDIAAACGQLANKTISELN